MAKSNQVFEIEIPGKVGIKKNARKIIRVGRRIMSVPSDNFKRWEINALNQLYKERMCRSSTISGPLMVEYRFHFKNRQNEPDVSNCVEGPQDCLEKSKIIENDRQIIRLFAEKVIDGTEKTVIKIFKAITA